MPLGHRQEHGRRHWPRHAGAAPDGRLEDPHQGHRVLQVPPYAIWPDAPARSSFLSAAEAQIGCPGLPDPPSLPAWRSPTTFRPLLTAPRLSSPLCRADKAEAETLPEDEKNVWDKDFVKVDDETLFNLILAANYLDIKSLLDLTCKTVADEIKGKTPEEIRVRFNIKNDFTPEECVAARPCPRPRFFVFASRTPSLTIVFLFCQLAGRKKSNERTHGARSAKPGGRAGSRLRGPTESPSVAYYA